MKNGKKNKIRGFAKHALGMRVVGILMLPREYQGCRKMIQVLWIEKN